jgi:hypothetical protein
MASAAPHLLPIPREIRDEIYEYFSHEVVIERGWELTSHNGIFKRERFANAPVVSVLLSHSRLHDEYIQSDSSKI